MPASEPHAHGSSTTLALRGSYGLANVPALCDDIRNATTGLPRGAHLYIDFGGVERIDGSAIAVIEYARRELEGRGVVVEVVRACGDVEKLLHVYSGARPSPPPAGPGDDLLTRAGLKAAELAAELTALGVFLWRLVVSVGGAVRRPRSVAWKDLPGLMEQAGADGVPIIVLVNFLIGFVTAFEANIQLQRFGATIYVADLVGASVVRELGPLMTAVIVAGRTGAAYAAELATMRVSEEVDALRSMSLDPLRYLVVPRVLALLTMLPMLTLVGDAFGLFGGLMLARLVIGINPAQYMTETKGIVFSSDIFWGVGKSAVFALTIGVIACQKGLSASGGASGVGRRTTSAVVSILFALILIDVLFAPLFRGHFQ